MPAAIKTIRPSWSDRKPFGHKPEAKRDPTRRGVSKKVYNSETWQRLRRWHLSRFPICVQCSDAGAHVDHIHPISLGGAPFDPANLQTLCHSCHSKKTAAEFSLASKAGGTGDE